MNLRLNKKILETVDVTAAVIYAVADSAGVDPITVRDVANIFPYVDNRTIRNKLISLAEHGFLNRVDAPFDVNSHIIVAQFEKKTLSN